MNKVSPEEPKYKSYTCEWCHEEFNSDWSDEDANAEAESFFGIKDSSNKPEVMAVVCDDCFQKMHPSKFPELAQQARKELAGE